MANRFPFLTARWLNLVLLTYRLDQSRVEKNAETIAVHHNIMTGGRSNTIGMIGSAKTICPASDSMECFFKEHEWGFGTSRAGRLIRYKVLHPIWNIHPVLSSKLDFDWQAVYGPAWKSLQEMEPMSVILAEGSAVKVFLHGTLSIG